MGEDYATRLERLHEHLASAAELADRVAKDFGRDLTVAKSIDTTETATQRGGGSRPAVTWPDDRHDAPDTGGPIDMVRTFSCPSCGCGFKAASGVQALAAKRRVAVGLEPEDRDRAVKDALRAGATGKGYGRVQ